MTKTATFSAESMILIQQEIEINAPLSVAFEALLEQLGPASEMPDGTPMPMKLEAWPGGRWYRDLGNNAGHFWGHVQVIKPPKLLEIWGPLFMSYPAISHLAYRLTAEGNVTRLKLTHRAIGQIPPEHREALREGMEPWSHTLTRVREVAERRHGVVGGNR